VTGVRIQTPVPGFPRLDEIRLERDCPSKVFPRLADTTHRGQRDTKVVVCLG